MAWRVRVDAGKARQKIATFSAKAQPVLDQKVLADSNKYAPMDTGNLIGSSLTHSAIGSGRLAWVTVYARRLYYNPQYNFSHDKNPNAGGLWFVRAKAAHLLDWVREIEQLRDREI